MSDPTFEQPVAVRQHLIDALRADLVGPYDPNATTEVLELPPSRWYLTGFIAPKADRELDDPTENEPVEAGSDTGGEEGLAEGKPTRGSRLPASIGVSVLLPSGPDTDTVTLTVRYADYLRTDEPTGSRRDPQKWQRIPRDPVVVTLPLDAATIEDGVELPNTGGLRVVGLLRQAEAWRKPARALALFVVNERPAAPLGKTDEAFAFQIGLSLTASCGFVERPNPRGAMSEETDEQIANLQFRAVKSYAVGHGVSVEHTVGGDGTVTVHSTWVPAVKVVKVAHHGDPRITTSMEALAQIQTADDVVQALEALPSLYGEWIQRQKRARLPDGMDKPRQLLTNQADTACKRIANGINTLVKDETARRAFALMNRAMADQALQKGWTSPGWRLFQLAFVLLNLDGLVDPGHPDRKTVELIFFPTGGGKTEAYLGVIAFTLLHRRLTRQATPDRGLGVAVLLRYTLRLLTLDQLKRASALICALELLRRADPADLGPERFSIGLWVGQSATANTFKQVAEAITEYRGGRAESPFPLTECPWCSTGLDRDTLIPLPNSKRPTEVRVSCPSLECPFNTGGHHEGLPVLFVDEQIYRELPSFVLATVDKLAMMPWRGETGMLFGRVHSHEGRRFYGPTDSQAPAAGHTALPDGLPPPSLIVQDEVHLITGPLGTMVGLYESVVEMLCTRARPDGTRTPVPKIVASTATVRRAVYQLRDLFARDRVDVFPPNGIDAHETWFAHVDTNDPGRIYVAAAAPGRSMKALLLRTYVALLTAAEKAFERDGPPDQVGDPYMTLAGYFNSLRELGGMRRLVEDDVRSRAGQASARKPLDAGSEHRWTADRQLAGEPVELTSRESTAKIKQSKARLDLPRTDDNGVDVLLASNMISVGVDIDRLGLMVVAGQPKTTAEYIQASSRVGRKHPGLVVTCLNTHKPRDRSHYEHFVAYHEAFYRYVEANSLTPFAEPALDRGLAGALVALVRLDEPTLTPGNAVERIGEHPELAQRAVDALVTRMGSVLGLGADQVATATARLRLRLEKMVEVWTEMMAQVSEQGGDRCYSRFEPGRKGRALLFTALEDDDHRSADERRFKAPTSMRDVEPSVHLWRKRGHLEVK